MTQLLEEIHAQQSLGPVRKFTKDYLCFKLLGMSEQTIFITKSSGIYFLLDFGQFFHIKRKSSNSHKTPINLILCYSGVLLFYYLWPCPQIITRKSITNTLHWSFCTEDRWNPEAKSISKHNAGDAACNKSGIMHRHICFYVAASSWKAFFTLRTYPEGIITEPQIRI